MNLKQFALLFTGAIVSLSACAQTILIPQEATTFERRTAGELSIHLEKCLGKTVLIKTEGDLTEGKPLLFVGNTAKAGEAGIRPEKLGCEEWIIRSLNPDEMLLCGGTPRGTLYAVYELLEREFGVVFVDEFYTCYPDRGTRKWPESLNLTGKPSFAVRGMWSYRNPATDRARQLNAIRNRQNFFCNEFNAQFPWEYGILPIYGSPMTHHTYSYYSKNWKEKDEDCFSLKDGKRLIVRDIRTQGQICFTNPKTKVLFLKQLREYIRLDRETYKKSGVFPFIYSLTQNDNSVFCECPGCRESYEKFGSMSGTMLEFTNAIADEIAMEYPEILLEMFAYSKMENPPVGIKASPNVIVLNAQFGSEWAPSYTRETMRPITSSVNDASRRKIDEWSSIARVSFWEYWTMYHSDTNVTMNLDAIADNMRYYQKLGATGRLAEMEYPLQNVFYTLKIWFGYRFMYDCTRDPETEITRYLNACYGPAAQAMKELLQYIVKRNAEITGPLNRLSLLDRSDMDDVFFDTAWRLLDKAEASAGQDAGILRRIGRERAVIGLVKLEAKKKLRPFDVQALYNQIKPHYENVLCDFYSDKEFKDEMEKLGLCLLKSPQAFEKIQVAFDFSPLQMKLQNQAFKQDDSKSDVGQAVCAEQKGEYLECLHFGFYWPGSKNYPSVHIPVDKLPKDGNYHWYTLGVQELRPNSYFYTSGDWTIQTVFNTAYSELGHDNRYVIFASIRLDGLVYTPGSKGKNLVMLDRVLLVEPKELDKIPPVGLWKQLLSATDCKSKQERRRR